MDYMDGVFLSSDLTREGYLFTEYYFDFNNGYYLSDIESNLALELPSLFNIEDSLINFNMICGIINDRFTTWKSNYDQDEQIQ